MLRGAVFRLDATPPKLRLFLLASAFVLPGCQSLLTEGTADVAGIAGAGAASAVTNSAAGAAAIGLGVRSLASEGLKYVERRLHRAEQDAIATAAGRLAEGSVARWQVSHDIPIEDDEHGEVVVARSFGAGEFHCKDIVFSVETTDRSGPHRAFFTATTCQDDQRWRRASAEPATERWGGLW